jgi:predicted TPR repeat methyltransferase
MTRCWRCGPSTRAPGRGNVFERLKRYEEALAAYDKALALEPDLAEAWLARATALRELNRSEEAIAAYRRALECGGDRGEIEFALAALGAETSPVVAPKQHVTSLFDKYADTFDEHLVSALKYQTSALLFDAIARFAPPDKLDILDLGCGTGLFGPQLRRSLER